MPGAVQDIITPANFCEDRLRGFGVAWRGVEIWPFPLTCFVAFKTLSHYRASVWFQFGRVWNMGTWEGQKLSHRGNGVWGECFQTPSQVKYIFRRENPPKLRLKLVSVTLQKIRKIDAPEKHYLQIIERHAMLIRHFSDEPISNLVWVDITYLSHHCSLPQSLSSKPVQTLTSINRLASNSGAVTALKT